MSNHYQRIGKIELTKLEVGIGHRDLLGKKGVKLNTRKLKVFRKSGFDCHSCDLKGEFWALEVQRDGLFNSTVVNLYGVKPDGTEVMMTQDHIKPRSDGGSNALTNLQTMCSECNHQKRELTGDDNHEAYTYATARARIRDIVYAHNPDEPKHMLFSKLMSTISDVYRLNGIPVRRGRGRKDDQDPREDTEGEDRGSSERGSGQHGDPGLPASQP